MRTFLCVLSMLGMIFGFPAVMAERLETTGYTELGSSHGSWGQPLDHNYGVFRKAREIRIITSLMPAKIMERDGKLVRTNTILNRLLPVTFYSPASPAEENIWRQHFVEFG